MFASPAMRTPFTSLSSISKAAPPSLHSQGMSSPDVSIGTLADTWGKSVLPPQDEMLCFAEQVRGIFRRLTYDGHAPDFGKMLSILTENFRVPGCWRRTASFFVTPGHVPWVPRA